MADRKRKAFAECQSGAHRKAVSLKDSRLSIFNHRRDSCTVKGIWKIRNRKEIIMLPAALTTLQGM